MSAPAYAGTFTALVTPFTTDGKLDEDRYRQQIQRQLDGGVTGIVPVGTTGESPTLDMDEHKRAITIACEFADRTTVIAGVGANATDEAAELHQHAKDAGAHAGLSVNPYYNKPTQEGLYQHFAALSDRVDLPIVLYNIPGRCGVTMSPETVARLHADHNVPAIKEATGLPDMTTAIAGLCDIALLSGDDALTLPLMSVGARGLVSVATNLVPEKLVALVDLANANDFHAAGKLHAELFPLCRSLFLDGNPAGIKAAMQLIGTDTGVMRLPIVGASDATRQTIKAEMTKLGLL